MGSKAIVMHNPPIHIWTLKKYAERLQNMLKFIALGTPHQQDDLGYRAEGRMVQGGGPPPYIVSKTALKAYYDTM